MWDASTGRPVATLEGHTDWIYSLSFSCDGTVLVSKSQDHTVRFWRRDTWEPVTILDEPTVEFRAGNLTDSPGVFFHPRMPLLATLGEQDTVIRIWEVDVNALLNTPSTLEFVRYTSAKIVLVGESNVGKSCLAYRLAKNLYNDEMKTTHGMQLWPLLPEQIGPKCVAPEGEKRDVVLWDMGGQDEYRLVHQLFLHDTTLAIFLMDASRGRTAFEEIRGWNRRLEKQMQGRRTVKILVGTKVDHRSNETTDNAGVELLKRDCGFTGYYETSAKTGRGVPRLKSAITEALDWEELAKTSRPLLFQRVRDEIENRRLNSEVVVLLDEIAQVIRTNSRDEFDLKAVEAVVSQLAVQGVITSTRLSTGERALVLQVPQVERYAASLIVAARDNPRGVPAVEEQMIASASMVFRRIPENERLPRLHERVVLECVVQFLVEQGICLVHEGLLIFPSLFKPTTLDSNQQLSHSVSLHYDFSGAIDNVYSSLVASLALGEAFGQMRLWSDRAEFETLNQGACGIRKTEGKSGFAHLDVYFEDVTPNSVRELFISFVEDHVRRHGVDIREHVEIVCKCGCRFAEETVRDRLSNGARDIGCSRCDHRTLLSIGADQARERDLDLQQRTWALKTSIEKRRVEAVTTAKRVFSQPDPVGAGDGFIRVLHLSDLHFSETTDVAAMIEPLTADLQDKRDGLGLERLDYLVVSGDMTNAAQPKEYAKAREFVSTLIQTFQLTASRCVLVPGNHDVNWDESVYDWKPRRNVTSGDLLDGEYVEQGEVYLLRSSSQYPLRFKNFNEDFYHPLIQQEYPLNFEEQFASLLFPDTGLHFLTLNSCWQIDEYHRKRAGLHQGALARGLARVRENEQNAYNSHHLSMDTPLLRIAVWHHAITGNDKIFNDAFTEQITKAGFSLCLHGDVHELRTDLIGYQQSRQLHVAGTGSFGANAHARPESTPRLYNLLEIAEGHKYVRVHTRCQQRNGGSFSGYAVWPSDRPNEKRAYYEIKLP